MAVTFDTSGGPAELIIQLDSVTLSYTSQEIYSAWKDWVLADNANWPPAFRVVGGDDLGEGATAPSFYFVRNDLNWRVRMPEADIEAEIKGNTVSQDPSADLTVGPVGAFSPTLEIVRSEVATNDLDAFARAVAEELEGANIGGSSDLCAQNITVRITEDPQITVKLPSSHIRPRIAPPIRVGIPANELAYRIDTTIKARVGC